MPLYACPGPPSRREFLRAGALALGGLPDGYSAWLRRVQNDLFDVGADLSVPFAAGDRLRITQSAVDELERLCDELNAPLSQLKSFVLPGGTETAAKAF